MGIREWYKYNESSSSSTRRTDAIILGQGYNDTKRNDTKWRSFWRKIKLVESPKRKQFYKISSSSVRVQSSSNYNNPYDPITYSENFDQGMGWEEPDNLSRSFSARFADPSRVFSRHVV